MNTLESSIKIQVKNIYKIFGPRDKEVLPLVQEGLSKDELLEKTGQILGINNVSLDIEEGEIFVIMGLSGSGKSTMIRHFNRLIEPTSGDIVIDGTNIMELGEKELRDFRRKKISMVFQRFGLLPHKTVAENVAVGLLIDGMSEKLALEKSKEKIEAVGLSGYEDYFPAQLSGGMQQRVGLARALATDADIMLMDEAFSALDPLIRHDMQEQLLELQGKLNKTIVFITHDLDEALKLGTHIAILKDGSLRQVGTPDEILLKPADSHIKRFVQNVNRGLVVKAKKLVHQEPLVQLSDLSNKELLLETISKSSCNLILVQDDDAILGGLNYETLQENEQIQQAHIIPMTFCDGNTVINDLLEESSQTNIPLAVTGRRGEFIGCLSKKVLLATIARK